MADLDNSIILAKSGSVISASPINYNIQNGSQHPGMNYLRANAYETPIILERGSPDHDMQYHINASKRMTPAHLHPEYMEKFPKRFFDQEKYDQGQEAGYYKPEGRHFNPFLQVSTGDIHNIKLHQVQDALGVANHTQQGALNYINDLGTLIGDPVNSVSHQNIQNVPGQQELNIQLPGTIPKYTENMDKMLKKSSKSLYEMKDKMSTTKTISEEFMEEQEQDRIRINHFINQRAAAPSIEKGAYPQMEYQQEIKQLQDEKSSWIEKYNSFIKHPMYQN